MMTDHVSTETGGSILIYDGQCRLCVRSTRALERLSPPVLSSELRCLPYGSEEARSLLGEEYRSGRPDVAFLIEPSGTVRRGLDAFVPLLPGLPGGRTLSTALKFPLLRSLAGFLYKLVARHRYRWFGAVQ